MITTVLKWIWDQVRNHGSLVPNSKIIVNYETMKKKQQKIINKFNQKEILCAVKKIKVFRSEEGRRTKLKANGRSLALATTSPQVGEVVRSGRGGRTR